MDEIVSKSKFAELISVHPSRVSQYISEGKIFGDAIVGKGHRAQIRQAVAREQLRNNLDIDQRIGANARAQLGDGAPAAAAPATAPPTIDDKLKRERLEQLELANERAREDRSARAGVYLRSDDARREMGHIASDFLTMFESALGEFATAIAAKSNLTQRDAAHLLRVAWRSIRERSSDRESQAAAALPMLIAGAAETSPLDSEDAVP